MWISFASFLFCYTIKQPFEDDENPVIQQIPPTSSAPADTFIDHVLCRGEIHFVSSLASTWDDKLHINPSVW